MNKNYVVDIINKFMARCNDRLYALNKNTGRWMACAGTTNVDEVHAIAQALIRRDHQEEMNAEVAVVNLLRELRIERMPILNRNQI